jgi:type I restriction enzyme M protein
MLAPCKGRIYDPACGSGGSLPASRLCGVRFAEKDRAIAHGVVQSEKFVESHGGKLGDISIYGQDKWARRQRPFGLAPRARRVRLRRQQPKQSNATTRRLAVMNLALRGIEADFGPEHADTATRVSAKPKPRSHLAGLLRSERQLLANPLFNDSDTALRASAFPQTGGTLQVMAERQDNFRKDDDVRWQPSGARQIAKGNPQGERGGVHQFGVPPKGNANFAWVQHFIHHLASHGMAGFVLANGSMSSNQSGECVARSASSKPEAKLHGLGRQREIRRALIEADLVDCMVALPGQLFYSTQIPVCLWFCVENNTLDSANDARLFDGETELSLVA